MSDEEPTVEGVPKRPRGKLFAALAASLLCFWPATPFVLYKLGYLARKSATIATAVLAVLLVGLIAIAAIAPPSKPSPAAQVAASQRPSPSPSRPSSPSQAPSSAPTPPLSAAVAPSTAAAQPSAPAAFTCANGPDLDIITYRDDHEVDATSLGDCAGPNTSLTQYDVYRQEISDQHAAGRRECVRIGLDSNNPNFFNQQGTYLSSAPPLKGPVTAMGDCPALAGVPSNG